MLECFLDLALQGLSPLLCFFHKLSPNLAGKVEVCGLCQLDCEIEGLPILSQRKSPFLEDGPRVSNTSHLAKWPWKWRCLWAEMVIGNSWQRGNSEAMCLPRDVSDCIWGKKLEPTKFFTCRKEPAVSLYRKAKTNSSVLVSCGAIGPQQLSRYTTLAGNSGYGASRPMFIWGLLPGTGLGWTGLHKG